MGASDSKLVFKQGILKLSEPASIPVDEQWTGVSGSSGLRDPVAPLNRGSFGIYQNQLKMFSASSPRLMSAALEMVLWETLRPLSLQSPQDFSHSDIIHHSQIRNQLLRNML
jgi:hypothetical protein